MSIFRIEKILQILVLVINWQNFKKILLRVFSLLQLSFLSLIKYPSAIKYILNYPRVVASYIESPNTELHNPEIKLF